MPQVPLTDIHVHLAPALDDGPSEIDQAVVMARAAAESGIRTAICTPHFVVDHVENQRTRVEAALDRLREAVAAEGIELAILPGNEAMAHPSLPERIDRQELLTLGDGGRYVLTELPAVGWMAGIERMFYEIRSRGLDVILAHPERYRIFRRSPESAQDWVARGWLLQVNAAHLLSPGTTGQVARAILESGCAHLVASDGHSPEGVRMLSSAMAWLAQRYGEHAEEHARWNARAVVTGEGPLAPIPASKPGRSRARFGWWKRWLDQNRTSRRPDSVLKRGKPWWRR